MTTVQDKDVTRRFGQIEISLVGFALLICARPFLGGIIADEQVQTYFTVLISIVLQALPFLVLGVLISGAIAAFVPPERLASALPSRPLLAVPVAGVAGALLPGCECGSVPVASGLISRGVPSAAALTFLLSAPAINPVVLVSTAVAFTGQPSWVLARLLASLATAVLVGWVWSRVGKQAWLRVPVARDTTGMSARSVFVATAQHDFLHAGGFLVIGGITAAFLNVVVPQSVIDTAAGHAAVSVAVLALLAVVMSICSEADAFVAASLVAFSPSARLAFLVVGPMVDLKLIALQVGTFGAAFSVRFVPLTLIAAIPLSVVTARWLL